MDKFDKAIEKVYSSLMTEAPDKDSSQKNISAIKPFGDEWKGKTMPQKAASLATGGKELKRSSDIADDVEDFTKGPKLKKTNDLAAKELKDMEDKLKDTGN